MNCKNCGAKLSSISKFCPECGAKIDLPEAPKQNSDTSTIEGVMSDLVNQFGKDVYKKDNATKLKNLLCDLAVKFPRELKLLTRVVPEGLQEILLNADNGSEDEKQSAVTAFQKQLVENAFLSDQVAAEAANILTVGLGWKIKLAVNTAQQVNTSQPVNTAQQVNTSQSVSQAVVQNAAPVHKDQSNTESKYSDSYLNSLSAGELSVLESKTHDAKVEFEIGKRFEAKNLLQKAQVWYQKAAAKGYEKAQKKLSSMNPVQASATVQTSASVQSNQPLLEKELTADYLYDKSIDELMELERKTHNPKVQYFIANAYAHQERKYEKAIEFYQRAGEQGFSYASYYLGDMYYQGLDIPQDYTKAFKWFMKAAELGNASAQDKISTMYMSGNGIPRDYQKGYEWAQKAAAQGIGDAMGTLGLYYENGYIFSPDLEKAREWYLKAVCTGNDFYISSLEYIEKKIYGAPLNYEKVAQNGDVYAMCYLAYKYRYGKGVQRDKQKAFELHQKAAESGNALAQYRLGHVYHWDKFDHEKAREWYLKAAKQGWFIAKEVIELIPLCD